MVRGNNDGLPGPTACRKTALLEAGGLRLFAIHDRRGCASTRWRAGIRVVVCGNSHRPLAEQRGPVLYLNPGSAGPRRFKLPISIAELRIEGATIAPRLVELRR